MLKARLPVIFKAAIAIGAAIAIVLMLGIDAKFWGVVVMGGIDIKN